jgi:V8-like Glu-specific endopeptidase
MDKNGACPSLALFILLCCMSLITASAGPCGSWDSYNNSCYKFVASAVTWDDARQRCDLESATLVTIDNSYENDFVSELSSTAFWIGLNDISQEGVFVWISGSTSAYRNWNIGEPNDLGGEDCAHIIASSTLWNDRTCTHNTEYVCEKGAGVCRELATPQNGNKSNENHAYGSIVDFSCDVCYFLTGSVTIQCNETNQQWNGTEPTCQMKTCKQLVPPANGHLISNETDCGSVVQFGCDDCYTLNGSSHLKCTDTQQWNGTEPTCEPKNCPVLDFGTDVLVTDNQTLCGSIVEFNCTDKCSDVIGSPSLSCLPNFTWSHNIPMCQVARYIDFNAEDKSTVNPMATFVALPLGDGLFLVEDPNQLAVFGATLENWEKVAIELRMPPERAFDQRVSYEPGHNRLSASEFSALSGSITAINTDVNNDLGRRMMELYRLQPANLSHVLLSLMYKQKGDDLTEGPRSVVLSVHFANGCITPNITVSFHLVAQNDGCGKSCSTNKSEDVQRTTNSGEFPWQASLCSPLQGYICSGVVIGCSCIITAADCIVDVPIHNLTVCVGPEQHCGSYLQTDPQSLSRCFKPVLAIRLSHLKFIPFLQNDIAFIKLPNPSLCSCSTAMPICLPNRTGDGLENGPGYSSFVTGWGKVNSSDTSSSRVHKAEVRLMPSYNGCEKNFLTYRISDSSIYNNTNGACAGDKGGPVILKRKNEDHYVLAGVISQTRGCGTARETGVYTSLVNYLYFVEAYVPCN